MARKTTKKAEPVVEKTVAVAAEVTETPVKAEESVTPVKKTRTRKTAAKKTTAAKEAATQTSAAKKEPEVFIQWWGKEVSEKEIVDRIKNIWTEEMGKKEAELKDLKVYVKPEEDRAHYVINGEIAGHIEI